MNDIFGQIKPKNKFSSSTMTIIAGASGAGKTTLATSAQELGFCVLVNFENRISHIDESDNLRIIPTSKGEFREDKICTRTGFNKFLEYIKDGKIKADYIIIDTIDAMFEVVLKDLCLGFQDKRQAYQAAYDEMNSYFKVIKNSGCNVICTSHTLNDAVLGKVTIALNEKLRNKINDQTDNVFYYEVLADETRVLKLKSTENIQCKLTVKGIEKYNNTVKELINPTWKDIHDNLGFEEYENKPIIENKPVQIDEDVIVLFKKYLAEKNVKDISGFCKEHSLTKKTTDLMHTLLTNGREQLDQLILMYNSK